LPAEPKSIKEKIVKMTIGSSIVKLKKIVIKDFTKRLHGENFYIRINPTGQNITRTRIIKASVCQMGF